MAKFYAKAPDGSDALLSIVLTGFTQSLQQNGWCKLPNGLLFQWHFGHGYPIGGKPNYRYIMNKYAIAYNAVFIGITSHSTINQNNILGTTANGIDIRTTEIHIGLSTYPETGDNMTNWDEFDISIGY